MTGNIIIDSFIPSADIKFCARGPRNGVAGALNSRVTFEFIYLSQDTGIRRTINVANGCSRGYVSRKMANDASTRCERVASAGGAPKTARR